jgi:hypothetical protein
LIHCLETLSYISHINYCEYQIKEKEFLSKEKENAKRQNPEK